MAELGDHLKNFRAKPNNARTNKPQANLIVRTLLTLIAKTTDEQRLLIILDTILRLNRLLLCNPEKQSLIVAICATFETNNKHVSV